MAITFEEASNLMTASFIYRNIPEDFNPPYNHYAVTVNGAPCYWI